jgi:hypothetical protein
MSSNVAIPLSRSPFTVICYIMFQEKVAGTFKEMDRIKYRCNFSILNLKKGIFSETPKHFKALRLLARTSGPAL